MESIENFGDWLTEQMQKSAKLKWKKAGCPENRDLEFWFEAEKEFPLPQGLQELLGMGYGYFVNDPFMENLVNYYKERYVVIDHD